MIDAPNAMTAQAAQYLNAGKVMTPSQTSNIQKAREKAEEFEAVFIAEALRPMFANIKVEKPFGGGPAEDMWQSLQVDEFGKAIAKSGGFGIADAVFREILKAQE